MKDTMIQFFEWYLPADGQHWKKVSTSAADLAKTGFTMVWLPPAYKGAGGRTDVGYGVYDMYDLGEFRQKGTIGTKYGTRAQYLKAVKDLQKRGIRCIGDIVFNHRMGADELETTEATRIDYWDRGKELEPMKEVEVWSKYTFPGRKGKYSTFTWNWTHFTGTDYDQKTGDHTIILFKGKHWNNNVSKENGNFDFIMGDDLDFSSQEVIGELYDWGKWYTQTTQISGFRLDAVKSIDSHFFEGWLRTMHQYGNHPNFAFGEYWSSNLWDLKSYLKDCNYSMKLLDVPLHFRLQQASTSNGNFDVRTMFSYTLTDTDPYYACAFVDNHDTQPTQALESWVLDWFKVSAYATILLNRCKCPIVFYGDYYGIEHTGNRPVPFLREMVWVRNHLLSDNIVDLYDEDHQKACWMAYGPHPVIVLYSIGDWKQKTMSEPNFAGYELADIINHDNKAIFDENGNSTFYCPPGGCSIFILKKDLEQMEKAFKQNESLRNRVLRRLTGHGMDYHE